MGLVARSAAIGWAAMTNFAIHFRAHVVPRLRNLARAEAVCVAQNVETYGGACSVVMRYAGRYGAYLLPPELIDELHEWVQIEIGEAIEATEPNGAR